MKKQYLFVAVSIFCWGTSPTVSKLVLGEIDTVALIPAAFLVASIVLCAILVKNGKIKELKNISLKDYGKMTFYGLLGMLLYNYFYLIGVDSMEAQQAFVVNYLWPACTILSCCIVLKEKMTIGKMIAVISSTIGVAIVTTNGQLDGFVRTMNLKGIISCVLAAVCYGFYSAFTKNSKQDKDIATFVAFATGTVLSALVVMVKHGEFHLTLGSLGGILWYGGMCNGIAFLCWVLALSHGDTAIISNLVYVTPFVSLLFTHFILGEEVTFFSILGLVFIVGGILIQVTLGNKGEKNGRVISAH